MYTVTRPWPFNTNSCIPPIETHTCAPPPKGARGRALVAQVTVEACGACHACARLYQTHAREVAPCGACARVPNARSVPLVVSKKWTRALKKGTIIINTAHGKVIDEDAMIHALEEGWCTRQTQDSQREIAVRALMNLPDFLAENLRDGETAN
ncbi:hypothetical protein B0H10DRAFT_2443858 [Mycena sp. CBHHK59/15]|nr:hypothetical protein B0H10DRAFT_2443858 [Mycena sp. CBHHK59/15]